MAPRLHQPATEPKDGGAIVQRPRNDGAWQQWRFLDSGGGHYRLQSRHSGKVLDVTGNSTADNVDIVRLPWRMGLLTQTNSPC